MRKSFKGFDGGGPSWIFGERERAEGGYEGGTGSHAMGQRRQGARPPSVSVRPSRAPPPPQSTPPAVSCPRARASQLMAARLGVQRMAAASSTTCVRYSRAHMHASDWRWGPAAARVAETSLSYTRTRTTLSTLPHFSITRLIYAAFGL